MGEISIEILDDIGEAARRAKELHAFAWCVAGAAGNRDWSDDMHEMAAAAMLFETLTREHAWKMKGLALRLGGGQEK
jgi:hypothetical protein